MPKRWLALLLILVLAGALAYGGFAATRQPTQANDLEEIPEVVAEVNGEEITKGDFEPLFDAQRETAEQQSEQGGEQVDELELREQVVQSLVTEELLNQEVARRKVTVTDRQVSQTLAKLATENGMPSPDAFVAALEDEGLDRKDIDEEVRQRTQFDRLIAREAGPLTASDKQVRELYQQLKEQQATVGEDADPFPPLKQVRSELEQQITAQQASQAATTLIDRLREEAEIKILI